jgi:Zn-dependent protease
VDPFETILVPALLLVTAAPFLFGWAKPVPVAFGRLNHPRRDMALVAVAGPLTNVALALASAVLLHVVQFVPKPYALWLATTLYQSILINLVLAIFNMIPLPPLDGGRVALSLLPPVLARPFARLERFGFGILLAIIFLVPLVGKQFGMNLDPFRWLVQAPLRWLSPIFLKIAGLDVR